MANFCRYCGTALNRDGRCPKCSPGARPLPGKAGFSSPTSPKTVKPKKSRFERHLTILAVILALVLITVAVLAILTYYNILRIPFFDDVFISRGMKTPQMSVVTEPADDSDKADDSVEDAELSNPGSYDVTPPDADEYFEEISTVISDCDAEDSHDIHSEADAYSNLVDRGFKQFPITTEYSIEGEYSKASEISRSSKTLHPIYQTYYITESGDIWVITEVNGCIIANPMFYNAESTRNAPVMLSEANTITAYDSTKNKFYVIEPYDSAMIIITVDRIDAQALESLTKGEIDKL